jgi:DNA polymerase delta, subunit 4
MADQKHDNEGDIDKLLAQFDGAREFGPCLGITRMERWSRAEKYDCNPSPRIKDILVSDLADNKPPRYQMPNMSSSAPKNK